MTMSTNARWAVVAAAVGCTTWVTPSPEDGAEARASLPPLTGTRSASLSAVFSRQALDLRAAAIGDLTGDGVDDLVVGEPSLDHPEWGSTGYGAVYVHDPSRDFAVVAEVFGEGPFDGLGAHVHVGDLDDDGVADLVVSSADTYVFYGPLSGSYSPTFADATVVAADVAQIAAGDVTGDGSTDLVLGVGRLGTAYLFDQPLIGRASLDSAALTFPSGSVHTGDVNGDGQLDLVTAGGTSSAWSYLGPVTADSGHLGHAFGAPEDGLLFAVVPDVTGDGADDIVVGSEQYGASNTGRVRVWDGATEYTITGHLPNQRLGSAVGGIGDLDGDGFGDLLVGAFGQQTTTLVYGPLAPNQTTAAWTNATVVFTGADTPSRGRGDFTGDGVPDLWLADELTDWVYAVPGQAHPPLELEELAPGDLVVTEIMANPATCSDTSGEWIEVYVAAEQPVDLAGLTIRDEAFTTGWVAGSLVVAPGAYVVLGTGTAETFCGPAADGHYGGLPKWNNTGDAVTLVDTTGRVLDATARFGAPLAASGISAALDDAEPDAVTNDDPTRWIRSTTMFGAEIGTPGAPNAP